MSKCDSIEKLEKFCEDNGKLSFIIRRLAIIENWAVEIYSHDHGTYISGSNHEALENVIDKAIREYTKFL